MDGIGKGGCRWLEVMMEWCVRSVRSGDDGGVERLGIKWLVN